MGKGSGGSRTVDKTHKGSSYKMTDNKIKDLKDGGFKIYVSADKYNESDMKNFNLTKVDKDITELASEAGIEMETFKKTLKLGSNENYLQFMSDERNNEGKPSFWVGVSMRKEGNVNIAEHEYYVVPDKVQGKGYAKKINKSLVSQYKNIGIDRVILDAGSSVGGYAWAQQGFYAKNGSEAYRAIKLGRKNPHYKEAEAMLDRFYEKHSYDTPFPMHKISSQSYGKDLLLGGKWKGFLDLHDKSQMERFNKYVNK